MWPYSYDSCDAGTFPGQIGKDGQPASAATGGLNGGILSAQPGQKLSACTCPGSDHPGPNVNVGRGVPEVDILEARIDTDTMQGQASQSFQCAPYDLQYDWNNATPATTIYNPNITTINSYKGGPLQEAVSTLTFIEDQFYGGSEFSTFAYELWSDPNNRDDGYITWYSNNVKTWTVTSATTGPVTAAAIGQRLIPEEPLVCEGLQPLRCSFDPFFSFSILFSIWRLQIVSRLQISNISTFLPGCMSIMSVCISDKGQKMGLPAILLTIQLLTILQGMTFILAVLDHLNIAL